MTIPKLEKSARSREYELYTEGQHAKVVEAYLFQGLSHRQIDKDVLQLDESYSRGYQSMGILHYLGLKAPFKGLFLNASPAEAIDELKRLQDPFLFCQAQKCRFFKALTYSIYLPKQGLW